MLKYFHLLSQGKAGAYLCPSTELQRTTVIYTHITSDCTAQWPFFSTDFNSHYRLQSQLNVHYSCIANANPREASNKQLLQKCNKNRHWAKMTMEFWSIKAKAKENDSLVIRTIFHL